MIHPFNGVRQCRACHLRGSEIAVPPTYVAQSLILLYAGHSFTLLIMLGRVGPLSLALCFIAPRVGALDLNTESQGELVFSVLIER